MVGRPVLRRVAPGRRVHGYPAFATGLFDLRARGSQHASRPHHPTGVRNRGQHSLTTGVRHDAFNLSGLIRVRENDGCRAR